tara:strand:- start:241 stop:807 length:567 start_codon:yes stop_codon:yes gene_type:complete
VIPLWWDILKESKLSGKAKGSTLDASKIKINIREECKEKLRKLIWFNTTEPAPNDVAQQAHFFPNSLDYKAGNSNLIVTKEFNNLPEEIACKILQELKSIDFDNPESYKVFLTSTSEGFSKPIIKVLGKNYTLWVEVDFHPAPRSKRIDFVENDVIRVYIINEEADDEGDVAWVMFPFSDIKKWKAAL